MLNLIINITNILLSLQIPNGKHNLKNNKDHQKYHHKQQYQLDNKINPEVQYPFVKYPEIDQYYFNKHTQQARLFAKKRELKMADPVQQYFQQNQQDQQPRKATMLFLKQIRGYYNTLNHFNNCLVSFGKNIIRIQQQSMFSKKTYQFSNFECNYPSQVLLNQLIDQQLDILYKTKTKLKIRKDNQRLLFPNWQQVITALKFIGTQFQKIQHMRQSNSQMLQMIHKKVLQDYQMIQNKIKQLRKNLQGIKLHKHSLNKDYKKYQAEQINQYTANTNNQPHLQMRYWLKRKIYQFKDLERRIRENQRDQTNYIRKLKYYKQKLSSFLDQNKKKYMKILKTRFVAFLDSYYITVDQSIQRIQTAFTINHAYTLKRPAKVHKLKLTKNINQALQNQNNYQKQYFQRICFYQQKLDGFISALDNMSIFLKRLQQIFKIMIDNLKNCEKNQQKKSAFFIKLFKHMIDKSTTIYNQIQHLVQVNQIAKKNNLPQLTRMKTKIQNKKLHCNDLLTNLKIQQAPIQYRYQFVKSQLEQSYKDLQEIITKIKQFENIYLLHSSRIKKIFIVSLISYLNYQKQSLKFGQINQKNISDGDYDMIEDNNVFLEEDNQNQNDISQPIATFDKGDNLQTGFGLTKQHLRLLNQFLFVAYTQWKQSQFFKKTLSEHLFILFNSQPNQNFSNIQVDSMNFSGLPPEIVWVKQLKSQKQIFIDVHLAFKGKWELNLKTLLKIFRSNWNLSIRANFQQFYCVMRVCFVPSQYGLGWFSFIGEPISKIDISLKIWDLISFEQQPVKNLFSNFLNNKLKKFTYPIKQSIFIPVSRQNQQLLTVQKRLKSMQSQKQL